MLAKPQGFPRKLGGCAGLDPRLRSAVSAGVGDGERGLRRGLRAPGVGVRPKWVLEYSPSNKRIRYFVSITYVRTGLWTAHKFCGGGECFTVRYRSGAVFEFDLVGFGRSNVRILRGLAPPSPPETSPTARTHSEAPAPSAESTHRHQFLAPQPAVSIRIEGDQRGDRIGDFLARQFAVSVGVQCGHDREIVENSGRTERTAPSTGPAAPSKPATRSTSPTTATFPAPATAAAKGADLGRQLRAAQHAVIVRVEGDQGVGCIENFGPREFSVPVGIHRRHHRHDNDGTPAPILRADHRGSECERNNTEPDKQDISCAGPDEARVLDHGNNQSTDTADEPC